MHTYNRINRQLAILFVQNSEANKITGAFISIIYFYYHHFRPFNIHRWMKASLARIHSSLFWKNTCKHFSNFIYPSIVAFLFKISRVPFSHFFRPTIGRSFSHATILIFHTAGKYIKHGYLLLKKIINSILHVII